MRNGKFEIFRQGLNDSAAEAVVQGRGQVGRAFPGAKIVFVDGSRKTFTTNTSVSFDEVK